MFAAITVVLGLAILPCAAFGIDPTTVTTSSDLGGVLELIRAATAVPALAAAVMRDGQIVALGAVGVRKLGEPDSVAVTDPFHLGSDTKAMTATLAAMLVQEGDLAWETTVADVFPDEATLNSDCRSITLEQLLTHRSGLPHNLPANGPYRDAAWQARTPPVEQRLQLLRDALATPPPFPPGERYVYSDVGYAIAGAMLERRAGIPWEDLMRARLFEPLGMRSAGFGYPARTGRIFGHYPDKDGRLTPREPGPGDDDPAALGPAGTVHCSMEDWARFALLHLRGAREDTVLLNRVGFLKLHTPPAGHNFAMGWRTVPRAWAGGGALSHAGSNGMFLALAWLAPEKDFGVLVATNCGGPQAEKACDRAFVALLQESRLVPPSAPR